MHVVPESDFILLVPGAKEGGLSTVELHVVRCDFLEDDEGDRGIGITSSASTRSISFHIMFPAAIILVPLAL